MATAAAALTVSGIALGYHGLPPAAAPSITSDTTQGPAVAVPDFTVQFTNGGHPDIISALSMALMARAPVGPELIQALVRGPLGPVLGPQPQPQPQALLVDESAPLALMDEPVALPIDPIVEDPAPAEAEAALAQVTSAERVAAAPRQVFAFAPMAVVEAQPVDDTTAQVAASQAEPAPEVVATTAPTPVPAKPVSSKPAPPAVAVHVVVAPPVREPTPEDERPAAAEKPQPVPVQHPITQAHASSDTDKATKGSTNDAKATTNNDNDKQGNDNGNNSSGKNSDNSKGSSKHGG